MARRIFKEPDLRAWGEARSLKVLVTNDDGVGSKSTRLLASTLRSMGHSVFTALPLGNWSGSSKSIGKIGRVRLYRFMLDCPGCEAVAADAPPAAMVAISIDILGFKPDIVVSGVNYGPNIGIHDLFSSGTVGAVVEAAFKGVKGMAYSSSCYPEDLGCIENAVRIAAILFKPLSEVLTSISGLSALSVNIPAGEPRGLRVVRASPRTPRLSGKISGDGSVSIGRIDHVKLYGSDSVGYDGGAYARGYISVMPIRVEARGVQVAEDLIEVVEESLNEAQLLGRTL